METHSKVKKLFQSSTDFTEINLPETDKQALDFF